MARSISLIMPAYNEENTLEFSVVSACKKLHQYNFDYEIFIFNDGSTDRTGEIADHLAFRDHRIVVFHSSYNMNLGYNFARGIEMATKEYAGLLPCHGQTDPVSFDAILPALAGVDVVVTYIFNPKVRPLTRHFVSRVNVIIINVILGLQLKYYHLNFYRTEILKKIPISTNSYAMMVELLVYAVKSGASYVQIPILLRKREFGKSKALRPKNIFNILKTYTRLFWQIRVLGKRVNLN